VDDEPDILEVIYEELTEYGCRVTTAGDYNTAKNLIINEDYDLIILDIMGVNGFALLETCSIHKKPAAMLTAHAVNVESLNLAVKLGAVSFLPKEELARLPELVAEILEGLAEGKSHWQKLFHRLGPFFKEKLGVVWDDIEEPPYPPYFY
jgi:DNA-binding response OmpR family regulator